MTLIIVILSLSVLIFVHELGHFLVAKHFKMPVEEFCIGFPPRVWKKQKGETQYSIGILPFGGFVKIAGENNEEAAHGDSFALRPFRQKSLVVLAGIFFNILAGYFALAILTGIGIPKHLLITNIAPGSPAESAGLKPGDIIVRAGEELRDPIETSPFIEFTNKNKGEEIRLEIMREKNRLSLNVLARENAPEGQGALGVELVTIGMDPRPFPKNMVLAGESTLENLSMIGKSFLDLITGAFTRPDVMENISGPVGIFNIATRAGNMGPAYLIQLMALISLNLAVLNLIPFPALDGGRFLFLCVEKIIRRQLSFKFQAIANTAGFLILILLMALITIKDVSGLAN